MCFFRTRFSRDLTREALRSQRCGFITRKHTHEPGLRLARASCSRKWREGRCWQRAVRLGDAGLLGGRHAAVRAARHGPRGQREDIRELIEVDDVMEDDCLRFGPNGGLVFCMEYFANNFDWLENCLGHVEDDYILFDCPGQIELYTHLPVMKQLVQQLEQWEFRVCGVFLVDSQFMVESFKFISGILAALSAMISLEIPQINIMTKMDLLSKKAKKEIEKFLDPDMYSLLEDSTSGLRSKKFKKLTNAICGLIDDYSMVRFLPYDQSDEESMNIVLQHIDFAIQYGEDLEFKEPKEHEEESASLFDEYFQERQSE
ncbi:GPN-loop GTPase 3 isoform X1 [Ochotona curzoniae]|uniref:GPN-loop GTPase 3 isoform X1 n=1 Tax=Ochotona curzoniae TaxID=130825 RepID=UPI001B351FF3|nr:GPN-loop GTPase 3 isoform X1 [Ochotona curzoniae]